MRSHFCQRDGCIPKTKCFYRPKPTLTTSLRGLRSYPRADGNRKNLRRMFNTQEGRLPADTTLRRTFPKTWKTAKSGRRQRGHIYKTASKKRLQHTLRALFFYKLNDIVHRTLQRIAECIQRLRIDGLAPLHSVQGICGKTVLENELVLGNPLFEKRSVKRLITDQTPSPKEIVAYSFSWLYPKYWV